MKVSEKNPMRFEPLPVSPPLPDGDTGVVVAGVGEVPLQILGVVNSNT